MPKKNEKRAQQNLFVAHHAHHSRAQGHGFKHFFAQQIVANHRDRIQGDARVVGNRAHLAGLQPRVGNHGVECKQYLSGVGARRQIIDKNLYAIVRDRGTHSAGSKAMRISRIG